MLKAYVSFVGFPVCILIIRVMNVRMTVMIMTVITGRSGVIRSSTTSVRMKAVVVVGRIEVQVGLRAGAHLGLE